MAAPDRPLGGPLSRPINKSLAYSRPPTCATCGAPTISRARQVESIAHCARCLEDVCWLDGVHLSRHRRCASCQVLVGPRHATTYLIDGHCPSCARWRAKGLPEPSDDLDLAELDELAVTS